MKRILKILLFLFLFTACKTNDDDSGQLNSAPEEFNLLTVVDQAEAVTLTPTFSWQPATDSDGDEVVYDFYLEKLGNSLGVILVNGDAIPDDPTTLVAQGLTDATFSISEPLSLDSRFTWKVVARDNQGGSSTSEIYRFRTRPLNTADQALVPNAAFSVREGHRSVFFKDKFWVIGGVTNIEDLANDVWSSNDGETWVLETADTGFSGRAQFGITVFNDRIFVVGGFTNGSLLNDVWSSANGVDWVQETDNAAFSPRAQTKLLAYKTKLYALGGLENFFDATTGSTEEIWSSTDGVTWELETNAAPYLPKYGFEAIVFDDKMFVIGGALVATNEETSDVWFSTDGENWNEIQQTGNRFSERVFFNSTVFRDKIWLTGGSLENTLEDTYYTDFWSSSDGTTWKRETKDAGYGARFSPALVANKDAMLVIGGGAIATNNKLNDVWKFD